jgi:hypothetical protein
MKTVTRVLLTAALLGVPAAASAQDVQEITPQEAATHIGQMARICGHVQSAAYLDSRDRSPTVMRVGGTYPYERINVIIYGENRDKFSPSPEEAYRGKDICVTGTVDFYDGAPSMVVDEPSDVQVQASESQ